MNRSLLLMLTLGIFISGGCGNPESRIVETANNSKTVTSPNTVTEGATANLTSPNQPRVEAPGTFTKGERPYIGCWTSYNGGAAEITLNTIKTRNSHKHLRYKDVTDNVAAGKGVYLLEILDKDPSNELDRYLASKILPANEMESRGYDDYGDFEAGTYSSIQSRWVKTSCSTARPLMR